MSTVLGKNFIRRLTASCLGVIVAVAAWTPLPARAQVPSAPVHTHDGLSADSCACSQCPGEDACGCHHGEAPAESTCSSPKPEPGNSTADTLLPTPVGKALCPIPGPAVLPCSLDRAPDAPQARRHAPTAEPIDKVPI